MYIVKFRGRDCARLSEIHAYEASLDLYDLNAGTEKKRIDQIERKCTRARARHVAPLRCAPGVYSVCTNIL